MGLGGDGDGLFISKSLWTAGGGDPRASVDRRRRDTGVDQWESPSVNISFNVFDISARWSTIMSSFSIIRGSKAAKSGRAALVIPLNVQY